MPSNVSILYRNLRLLLPSLSPSSLIVAMSMPPLPPALPLKVSLLIGSYWDCMPYLERMILYRGVVKFCYIDIKESTIKEWEELLSVHPWLGKYPIELKFTNPAGGGAPRGGGPPSRFATLMKYFPSLQTISLLDGVLNLNNEQKIASSLLQCTQITHLEIEYSHHIMVGNSLPSHPCIPCSWLPASLEQLIKLKTLLVDGYTIGGAGGLRFLRSISKLANLNTLIISNCKVGQSCRTVLGSTLQHLPNLKSLHLDSVKLSLTGGQGLLHGVVTMQELAFLDLGSCRLGHRGLGCMSLSFHCLPKLAVLILQDNNLTCAGAHKLQKHVHHLVALEELNLEATRSVQMACKPS